MPEPSANQPLALSERLLDLLERRRALQQQGQPANPAELCADCPELAEELGRLAGFVHQVETLSAQSTDHPAEPPTLGPGESPSPLAPCGRGAGGEGLLSPSPLVGEGWGGGKPAPLSNNRYAIEEKLGVGGMGTVYRARDQVLGRTVALKVIRPEGLSPTLRTRFEVEARAVAQLDHPHIVKVFDVGQIQLPDQPELVPFLTLEFIAGGSLKARLQKEPLPIPEVVSLVALLARAMQHAHERGIVHRDLKPDNILLAPPSEVAALNTTLGCPKITDFGLARQVATEQRLTGSRSIVGTPRYMAPEQAQGQPDIGPPADAWALGVLLYQLLTGVVPFDAPSVVDVLYLICREETTPPQEVRPDLPAELSALVLDCLRKPPEERPTAGQLAERLEQFSSDTPARPETVSIYRPHLKTRSRAGRWSRRMWVGVLIALVGVALLGGLTLAKWPNWTRMEPGGKPDTASPKMPGERPIALKIRPLQVLHYETVGDEAMPRGRLGQQSFATRHGDAVTLMVELSEPAYFYLLGFNFDGKEQLLWPVDETGMPSAQIGPPKLELLRHPTGENRLYLDDPAPGGLQTYAVAASTQPLPPYSEWRAVRGEVNWKSLPPGKSVWEADVKGTYEAVKGLGVNRGSIREAPGVPPLSGLCRSLRSGGVEAVEVLAFPVLPREEKK